MEVLFFFNVYFWERMSVSRSAEREGTEDLRRVPGWQQRAPWKAWTHKLEDHDLRSWPEPKLDTQSTGPPRHPQNGVLVSTYWVKAYLHVWVFTPHVYSFINYYPHPFKQQVMGYFIYSCISVHRKITTKLLVRNNLLMLFNLGF